MPFHRTSDEDMHGELREREKSKNKAKTTIFLAFSSLGVIYG